MEIITIGVVIWSVLFSLLQALASVRLLFHTWAWFCDQHLTKGKSINDLKLKGLN